MTAQPAPHPAHYLILTRTTARDPWAVVSEHPTRHEAEHEQVRLALDASAHAAALTIRSRHTKDPLRRLRAARDAKVAAQREFTLVPPAQDATELRLA